MNRKRGFEIVSEWKERDIHIPSRKTAGSAGYDIESAADADVEPGKIHIVPTGLKAYMENDEYLAIHIRSGIGIKHGIMLANNTGIIDSDYYNNEDNEGHIMCALYNSACTFSACLIIISSKVLNKYTLGNAISPADMKNFICGIIKSTGI